MSISAIRAYTNPAVNGAKDSKSVANKYQARENSVDRSLSDKDSSHNSLITKKERDFFIRMFPENAEQLEKHVVFNRNGRLQTAGTSKGILVDGRV
jgi:hypothetical protein